MALKATVFKCELNISDMDRHYYQSHSLTVARHPSEGDLRMMIRIIAFAINAHEQLQFTKGLSTKDEPDLWQKSLSDEVELWIDLGQLDEKRLRQACGKAQQVIIYTYNDKQAQPWQMLMAPHFIRHKNLKVCHIASEFAMQLEAMVDKQMEMQVSIQDGEIFVSCADAQLEMQVQQVFPKIA